LGWLDAWFFFFVGWRGKKKTVGWLAFFFWFPFFFSVSGGKPPTAMRPWVPTRTGLPFPGFFPDGWRKTGWLAKKRDGRRKKKKPDGRLSGRGIGSLHADGAAEVKPAVAGVQSQGAGKKKGNGHGPVSIFVFFVFCFFSSIFIFVFSHREKKTKNKKNGSHEK